jgi:gluconolactonase
MAQDRKCSDHRYEFLHGFRRKRTDREAGTAFTTFTQFVLLIALVLFQVSCDRNNHSVEAGRIVLVDPELINILTNSTRLDKLVGGFGLLEGPVWRGGRLFFSDMRSHVIYEWHPETGLSVFLKTGFLRTGPNGLAFDKDGRLTICEHGNRRVSRLEKDGSLTTLAEFYHGKRLNSPNDLVYRSDGLLYFTDPPFGLKGANADPQNELAFSGIFLLSNGNLQLLTDELSGTNGLTFSPDEKYLYVGNDYQKDPVIHRYNVEANGTLSNGELFFNARSVGATYLDGMKSDIYGNLYVTASSGIIFISATGKHLGTLQVPEDTTNIAWGDDDQKTLYVTGATSLYRIRLKIRGSGAFG